MNQLLGYSECGDPQGRLVVYFHGAPGGPEECQLFEAYAIKRKLRVVCFDRFDIAETLHRDDYYRHLADCIWAVNNCAKRESGGQGKVDIIGFSLGAQVAIEVAAILKSDVRQLHLVSAPAPLCQGDYLDEMAGGVVFRVAMQRPMLFACLTLFQKLIALVAPRQLFSMLFSSAQGDDVELSQQGEFKQLITRLLSFCFLRRTSGYMRDVKNFVSWGGNPISTVPRVFIWHGHEDNWSPYSMVEGLRQSLSGDVSVNSLEQASHYSCVYRAAPKICEMLEHDDCKES